jgi:hypothetical protein
VKVAVFTEEGREAQQRDWAVDAVRTLRASSVGYLA